MFVKRGNDVIARIESFKSGDLDIVLTKEPPEPDLDADKPRKMLSPMVLDLDGDGIETISVDESHVYFDLDADGIKHKTGWVGADDGLLVFDRNGDGVINDGRELFGDATLKYDGSGTFGNGFSALAQEDTNGDGYVNALDQNWSSLKVWRDANQNGWADPGELFSLDDLGITGFDLSYQLHGQKAYQNGNYYYGYGRYTTEDGAEHKMTDVFFAQDSFRKDDRESMEVSQDIKDNIPDFNGSGFMDSLWIACSKDENLKDLVTRYAAGNAQLQLSLIDELLWLWAENSSEKSWEENFGPGYTISYSRLLGYPETRRMLHVLEMFNGEYFFPTPKTINSTSVEGFYIRGGNVIVDCGDDRYDWILKNYQNLSDIIYQKLAMMTRFSDLNSLITPQVDEETGQVTVDAEALNDYFNNKLEANPVDALHDLIFYTRGSGQSLINAGWNGFDLALDFLSRTEITPELAEACEELGIKKGSGMIGADDGAVLIGTDGDDKIRGGEGNDYILGGDGNDILLGMNGNDIIYGGEGDDNIQGSGIAYPDSIVGPKDDIEPYGPGWLEYVAKRVEATEGGINYLYGEGGNDLMYGGYGLNYMYGGEGDDLLYGGYGGVNFLDGGEGNDTYMLKGQSVNTIVYGKGYGHDVFEPVKHIQKDNWTLMMRDLRREEIDIAIVGDPQSETFNIIFTIRESGETFTINNALRFSGPGDIHRTDVQLDEVTFVDGQVLTLDDILNEIELTVPGTDGDDVLTAAKRGGTTLDGGAGNDLLVSGIHEDILVFGRGYGHDLVSYSNYIRNDTVRLAGLSPDDIKMRLVKSTSDNYDYDLIIEIVDTGETFTIQRGIANRNSSHDDWLRIKALEFGDGTVLDKAGILAAGFFDRRGTAGHDVIELTGPSGPVLIEGLGGNDSLTGGWGADTLEGGDGDDHLY